MTPDENLSYVIEKIGLDGWRELQKNSSISIEEAAAAIRNREARGEPLEDPNPEEEKKKDDRPVLTLEYLNQYLYDNGISVRYNVISKEVEVSGMPEVFNPESLTSELHIILHDQLKSTFKCTKDGNVTKLLKQQREDGRIKEKKMGG